jgi:hypothetical protein
MPADGDWVLYGPYNDGTTGIDQVGERAVGPVAAEDTLREPADHLRG